MQGEFELKVERGCTDVVALIAYILFWGLMVLIGIVGFVNGNPARLTNGYDFNGNVCGQGTQSNKSYL